MNRVHVIRKIGQALIWYVFYFNLWFVILAPEIYYDQKHIIFLATIVLSMIINISDVIIRPFSEKMDSREELTDKYTKLLLISFLLTPLLYALAFLEYKSFISQYLPFWDNIIISYIGLVVLMIGGSILLTSRYQLKRYGSGMIVIEDDHELITSGIYRYIRHPIYSGGLIWILGFMLSLRSLIFLFVVLIFNFLILKARFLQEERLLTERFGDEYLSYMKRTKRLIPFIY
ncbi:MAG: methyltransferase family protein [Candidatus Hodarchaeales archaeon]